jgi:hypothetical protein
MAVCAVTRHAEHRTRERVGIPKKAVRRAAAKALTQGIKRTDTEGGLRRYLDWLYWRGNGGADNIVVYGDKVYLFNDDTSALQQVNSVSQSIRITIDDPLDAGLDDKLRTFHTRRCSDI